ncbi:MAG: hypothetical protein M3O68_09245 [Thermoproteota archaeon]|nr:hypothetical protein [Thermoproteota archaeon]
MPEKYLQSRLADYSFFATTDVLIKNVVSIGDGVLVIGYPLWLKHRTTNLPLVRTGLICTNMREDLEISIKENGRIRNRIVRGFIIDGGTSPGPSGSPVIHYPPLSRVTNEGVITFGFGNPYLLGIVSESRLAIVESDSGDAYPTLSELSTVFNADTIKETIEEFFPNE